MWIASELVSFDSYGIAPGALLLERTRLRPSTIWPQAFADGSGPMPTGGLAVFRILLYADVGSIKDRNAASELRPGESPR